jgi:hypothetical protein
MTEEAMDGVTEGLSFFIFMRSESLRLDGWWMVKKLFRLWSLSCQSISSLGFIQTLKC